MEERKSPYVIYVIDTETTGTDHLKHDVIEASYWRICNDPDNELDEQKTWCIRAANPDTIENKALHVNKHKREDILHQTQFGRDTYLDPKDAIDEMESWIMDDDVTVEHRVFVGQNPEFDYNFLEQLWLRNERTFPFKPFIIDTMQLVRLIDLCTGKRRQRYNLTSLVKDFGITKGKAHKASEDTKMTKDLFIKIVSAVRNSLVESFDEAYTK